MNIIGCLDRPTSGQYVFEGLDVATLTSRSSPDIRSRRIGFVFQSFNLLARTSAIENVELPLLYAGRTSAQGAQRSQAARNRSAARPGRPRAQLRRASSPAASSSASRSRAR